MDSSSWQLPTYITIGVIGGGMAVGLLVICVICGFCTIFNRKYDHEEREKRKVSLQAIAINTHNRPVDRLHTTPSPRPILIKESPGKPLRCESGPIFPAGDDEERKKKGSLGVVSTGASCEHCSAGLPVQVMRTNQGGTITSVLRHACACTLFMSTSPSDRSITGDELRQLASSSTEAIYTGTGTANNTETHSSRHDCQLSPLLTRDTDPLIVISDSTSSETIARTRKILSDRGHLNQVDPSSISSCCVSPQDELEHFNLLPESGHPVGRVPAPSRPVHVHPLLHPHFHAHSKDDLPMEEEILLDSCHVEGEERENIAQSLQLPSKCLSVVSQAASPISDFDSTELENSVKASWEENDGMADPCKALWGLRSVLEQRTGIKPEPVIRLIAESDTEMDIVLDESGQPVAPDGNQLQAPGSILTSLTSFESNTPSEESFDATSCARALEAIFDEPSDLPALSTAVVHVVKSDATTNRSVSLNASNAATGLYSSGTHLTPPVHRQQRKPSPPKLTSHQKRQSFKKAHHLAAKTTTHTTTVVALQVVTIDEVNPGKNFPTPPAVELKAAARSPSPNRLQQMKNDSGYKSQSLDHAASATPLIHIHAYKSVPHLPSELVAEEPTASGNLQTTSDLTESNHVQRYETSSLEAPNATFFLSVSSDADLEDASSLTSSAVPSLTSSMEIEAACARIPLLLTHPATPTTPPRDWTIDERSDRLFREFNRHETATARSNSLRAATGSSRQHRPLLPKRKSYSPSSSHTGTPAQASIEETEEEEEHTLCGGMAVVVVGQDDARTRQRSLTPDFFVCSTKEQLLNHMNMRSQSPELRNVPIIKLPDQESDEV